MFGPLPNNIAGVGFNNDKVCLLRGGEVQGRAVVVEIVDLQLELDRIGLIERSGRAAGVIEQTQRGRERQVAVAVLFKQISKRARLRRGASANGDRTQHD